MDILHQSQFFTLYQSGYERCFYLEFGHRKIRLTFCQLLSLRHKASRIEIQTHFDHNNTSGIEILSICDKKHLFVLDTYQAIDLKELIQVSFGMMAVHSLVSEHYS